MALSVAEKLKIKSATTLLALNAPAGFKKSLGPLPAGSRISRSPGIYHQIHWFVNNRAQMERELDSVLAMLKPAVICWIYYPKKSANIQTDLSRDQGWEPLLENPDLQWLSLVSFDDTWSTFAMRLKKSPDAKSAKPKEPRAIFDYVDPASKQVRIPEDLAQALKKEKAASGFFETLSFSNKKEYIEWVIMAKKEETRQKRVKGSIERLLKGWKNPANR